MVSKGNLDDNEKDYHMSENDVVYYYYTSNYK